MGYHHSLSPHAAALQLAIIVGAILGVVYVAALARTLLYREDGAFGVAIVSGVCLIFYLAGLRLWLTIDAANARRDAEEMQYGLEAHPIDRSEGEEP